MNEKQISVLFMDDEPTSEIVRIAAEWMAEEGFDVDVVESMRDAVDAFYEKFYDVFVLDIDMSLTADDENSDGVNVLERFVSLHNRTSVVMFSGAGTVPHWFAAANAHCYAYIHKNEKNSVRKLVEFIRKSEQDRNYPERFVAKQCPRRVLLFDGDGKHQKAVGQAVADSLGDSWRIETADSLENARRMLEQDPDFGTVLLFQHVFELYAEDRQDLAAILSMGPAPQAIVGCAGEDQFQPSILFVANNHPFRMIDILDPAWPRRLGPFLQKAALWYGQREIFEADPEELKRMRIALPPESLDDWEYDQEDLDKLYEMLEQYEPDEDDDRQEDNGDNDNGDCENGEEDDDQ